MSVFKKRPLAHLIICFILTFITGNTLAGTSLPVNQALYDERPFGLLYYYGYTISDPLMRIFRADIHRWPEHIQSIELSKSLDKDNIVRQFFNPLVGVVGLAGNLTIRTGARQNTIYEFDPYIYWRWANLPWNHLLTTSFAIGEGISYASAVPDVEIRNNTNTRRLLNYLMLEATFALPNHPELQLVTRIHHRSGAYGLYRAGNTGSNDIGLGIRYLFD